MFRICLSLVLVLVAATVDASPKIVAVFDIENSGAKLSKVALERLNTYLTTKVAGMGYQVVPRAELRKRLRAQRRESYKACYDQSCQIEIGRELAAQKSVSTKILRLGNQCVVTMALYDLRKSATERAGDATGDCGIGGLVRSLEAAARKLAPAIAPGMAAGHYKVQGVVDRESCPDSGTLRQGDPPPKGTYVWCVDAKSGLRNGPSSNWHTNGKLMMTGVYRANKQHGLWTIFHRNGKKYSETLYRDGRKEGATLEWDAQGNKLQAGQYKAGQKVGLWTRWINGKVYTQTHFRGDDRNGRYIEYSMNKDGAKQSEGLYKEGQRHGKWVFYNDGVKQSEGSFRNDKREGAWIEYRDGQVYARGSYRADKKHGVWREVRRDIETDAAYRDGKLHGPYSVRRNGQVTVKGQYRDNRRDGTWVHYSPRDGSPSREVEYSEGRPVR